MSKDTTLRSSTAGPNAIRGTFDASTTRPDETKRKAERKARAERKPYNSFESGNALSPAELAKGKTDKPVTGEPTRTVEQPEMTPSQLGYTGGLWSGFKSLGGTFSKDKEPETARFTREPARSTLTDPPPGYRTPSAEQPYGLNAAAPAKLQEVAVRHLIGRVAAPSNQRLRGAAAQGLRAGRPRIFD